MKKRLFGIALALCMLVSLLPFGAAAADIRASGECGKDGGNVTWTLYKDGLLSISGTGEMADYNFDGSPFYYSRNSPIKTIVIAPGVTSIGDFAFKECPNLTEISIPESVKSIGYGAFWFCSGLTSITIPNGVTSIGIDAFEECGSLTSISLPDTLTSLGEGAFTNCKSLKSIEIPSGVTSIADRMFTQCTSLTIVSIPDSVTSIGQSAFAGCTGLSGLTIPDSVTSIGDVAFSGCTGLTSILIPDSVTSIGEGAFMDCEGLADNDGFVIIRDVLYDYSGSGGAVVIPDGVTHVGLNAFWGCLGLTSITMPDGVTSIGDSAFWSCRNLTEATIPQSLTHVGYSAFPSCPLSDVYYNGTIDQWEDITIEAENSALRDATLHIVHEEHQTQLKYAYDATCTEDGYSGDEVCTICGQTIEYGDTIPAKGHSFGSWTVTTPATETAEGVETRTCSVCGETETQSIPKLEPSDPTPTSEPTPADPTPASPQPTTKPEDPTPAEPTTKPDDSQPTTKPDDPTPTTEPTKPSPKPDDTKPTTKPDDTKPTTKPDDTKPSPKPAENPFTDVKEGDYFFEPVLWALNHDPQITDGMTENTFAPGETCTRGQVVTFLWRAMGCAEPTKTDNPFSDVASGDYFYRAVLWAVEKGITDGTSATTFSPNDPCTRAHVVTFLCRAEGSPKGGSNNPFADVAAGEYYTDAVLWAVSKGITDGTSDTTFSPAGPCTRGQIVTFLYRDMK